jgi:hypothetical protein
MEYEDNNPIYIKLNLPQKVLNDWQRQIDEIEEYQKNVMWEFLKEEGR